jgi:AraC-like ligand binding domain
MIMTDPGVLLPFSVITVDDVDYFPFSSDEEWLPNGSDVKALAPPESGLNFIAFRFPPDFVGPRHWHDYSIIYIVKSGEFIVEGEGTYRAGDIRWSPAGTAYGRERSGPDGCEVYVISMGPIALHDPSLEEPPNGYAPGFDALDAAFGEGR